MKFWPSLIFILLFMFAPKVQAQDYATGFNLYMAHDFEGAERAFQQALPRAGSQGEKARLYKILGISQYMQGKRLEAARNFEAAKKLQPGITIESAEVIDKSVLDFFDSIAGAPPPPPPRREEKQKERPHVTQMIVLSNAVEGQVMVDGIHRGKVGDLLNVEPGLRTVEVYAPGYLSHASKVTVQAKGLNKFTFRLDRVRVPKKEKVEDVKVQEPEKKPVEVSPAPKPEKRRPLPELREVPVPMESTSQQGEWVHFLPLGLGQYLNDKPAWGLVFTVGQVGGLGFYALRNRAADRKVDDLDAFVDERIQQEESLDEQERSRFAAETDAIFDEENSKINQMRNEALLGIAVFGVVYGASILEGFLNPPDKPSWSWQPMWIPHSYSGSLAIMVSVQF